MLAYLLFPNALDVCGNSHHRTSYNNRRCLTKHLHLDCIFQEDHKTSLILLVYPINIHATESNLQPLRFNSFASLSETSSGVVGPFPLIRPLIVFLAFYTYHNRELRSCQTAEKVIENSNPFGILSNIIFSVQLGGWLSCQDTKIRCSLTLFHIKTKPS